MDRPWFRMFATTVLFVQLTAIYAFPAGDLPPQDALKLADDGKISIDAYADGAYSIKVRIRNHTSDDLNVSFPPGLVADTYARFALFQVGGGGGTSSGGGGQSTGLLFAMAAPVNANGQAVLNFQTACLNFGAQEPTGKTVLMIKRVEDFTPDLVFQHLLKDLAANPPEEHVSQAALWNVVDKLAWAKMAKIRTRRGRFSPEEIEEAQARVGAAQSAAASAKQDPNSAINKNRPRLPALSILIHPDPRGRHQDASLAREAARKLRERWPGVDVSHRDFTPNPVNEDADAVAWCFLVRSIGSAKSPDIQFTPQKNIWIPAKREWRHEPIGNFINKTPPAEDVGGWLANLAVQQIALRSIIVEKKDDGLLVRNDGPIGVRDVFVTTGAPKDQPIKLFGLSLEPGEAKKAEVPLLQKERYAAAKKISTADFTPMFPKTPPTG